MKNEWHLLIHILEEIKNEKFLRLHLEYCNLDSCTEMIIHSKEKKYFLANDEMEEVLHILKKSHLVRIYKTRGINRIDIFFRKSILNAIH